jgi:ADP-heptose:LPS heptosyltransferase
MTRKLLAINFGGIGDEVLFLPVLASIKEKQPDTHITLLLEPRSKAIKDISNLIDEIKLFDIKKRPLLPNDYLKLLHILRYGDYQAVVSSGSSPLVAFLLFASGIKERIGYDSGPLSHYLLTQPIKLNRNQYASTMYHDLVQGLGLKHKQARPEVQVPVENLAYMKSWLADQIKGKEKIKTIVIHPGTSKLALKKGIIKTWPANNWASLINQLVKNADTQVILAGGPDDEQTITQIMQELEKNKYFMGNQDSFVSAYGATKSLADLAALILISDLLICVDSAPMHIGVALKKQILALFGPTNPEHLLPLSSQCRYLKDINHSKHTKSAISTGINIQPNIVYQSASDLLQIMKVQ